MITRDTLIRYSELNANRDEENLAGWAERMTVWNNIRLHLLRDIKTAGVTECVLCHEYIDDGYVHDACLVNAVNYRDSVNRDSECFLYCLYKFHRLVYVGITKDPKARLRAHLADKNVDSMTVWNGGTAHEIAAMEKREIHKYYPVLNNRLHNKDGSQFLARDMLIRRVSFLDVERTTEEIGKAAEERANSRVKTVRELMQAEIDACRARIEFLEAQLTPVVPDTPELLEEPW